MSYNSSDWFIRLLINISLMVAAEAKGEKEKNKINLHPCDSHMFGGYPVETLEQQSMYLQTYLDIGQQSMTEVQVQCWRNSLPKLKETCNSRN